MNRIGYALSVCFFLGIYGCSQNDAGTNNNSNNAAIEKANKDSLLNAASKLNTPDSTNKVKDSSSKSH